MSNKCMAWAIEQQTGSAPRKLVLLLLADLADEQHTCYPSRGYLAKRAELSPTTVSKVITQLAELGYVRVLRRARRSGGRSTNRYLVMFAGADTPLPDIDDWVSEFVNDVEDLVRDAAGQPNGGAQAPMPDGDQETAGHGNGAPQAPMPGDGNGAPAAPSKVPDEHSSKEEDFYPSELPQDPPPPPTSHPAPEAISAEDTERLIARNLLRQVTADVDVSRLPTAAERDRLVDRVIELFADGWLYAPLLARLVGMGPLTTVASVYAVLTSRLRTVGPPPPAPAMPRVLPRWCAHTDCDPLTRRQLDDEGRPRITFEGEQRVPLFCTRCSGR